MTQLRIATFNLLHGQPLDPEGRPLPLGPDPAAPLAEAIGELDADVLALQEVDRYQPRSGRVDQAAVAAKALGATDYRFAAAVRGRPAPWPAGSPTRRWPMRASASTVRRTTGRTPNCLRTEPRW
ncbi:endonuclease/exonuclease/phosphatase family protein [Streptacidiphilus monticola]